MGGFSISFLWGFINLGAQAVFMDAKTRLLFWLLSATKGGPTRVMLLSHIEKNPLNIRKLAMAAEVDYKTAQAHVEMMKKYGVLDSIGGGYGAAYFISPEWEENSYLHKVLGGKKNEKKQNKKRRKQA